MAAQIMENVDDKFIVCVISTFVGLCRWFSDDVDIVNNSRVLLAT